MTKPLATTLALIGVALTFLLAPLALAQTAIGTIAVGSAPWGVAVNPTTNRVYVANFNAGSVSVIDGGSNSVVATTGVGSQPYGVDVNPTTNRVYVANSGANSVSVIDGGSNAVTATIAVNGATQVAVNPTTN